MSFREGTAGEKTEHGIFREMREFTNNAVIKIYRLGKGGGKKEFENRPDDERGSRRSALTTREKKYHADPN